MENQLHVYQDELSPAYALAGQEIVATLTVHSTATTTVSSLIVAVRDDQGADHDFPGLTDVTVQPGGTTATTGARTFPPGVYSVFGSYLSGRRWTDLPAATMLIAAAEVPAAGSAGAGTRLGQGNVFWDDFGTGALDASMWTSGRTSSYPGNGPTNTGDTKLDHLDPAQVSLSGWRCRLLITAACRRRPVDKLRRRAATE